MKNSSTKTLSTSITHTNTIGSQNWNWKERKDRSAVDARWFSANITFATSNFMEGAAGLTLLCCVLAEDGATMVEWGEGRMGSLET